MKRIILFFLVVSYLITLSACGETTKTADTGVSNQSGETVGQFENADSADFIEDNELDTSELVSEKVSEETVDAFLGSIDTANDETTGGSFGDGLTWSFGSPSGLLIIGGTGEMPEFGDTYSKRAPWYEFKSQVTAVLVEEGVKNISQGALNSCNNMEKMYICDGLQRIDNSAFSGCSKLVKLRLPNTLSQIGDLAFEFCKSLEKIDLPEHLQTIGNSAFSRCYSLGSILIPAGVTQIGSDPFDLCEGLCEINVVQENQTYSSSDGVLFTKDQSRLLVCPENKSGEYAVPNGVKIIADYAFEACAKITKIILPNSVEELGVSSFMECESLSEITLSSVLVSIGKDAFRGCDCLDNIVLPASVAEIGNGAFYQCLNLSEIVIPNGVSRIGDSAFYQCFALAKVTLPNSLERVGFLAFQGCKSINSVYYDGNPEDWESIYFEDGNDTLINAQIHFV